MKIIALIPARAGSQRVVNKNIKKLKGKPLIAYTIEAALASKLVDRVIVSTDSLQIAKIAQKYKAEVPFLRPKSLATANATELQFHHHALQWLKTQQNYVPDLVVNLYPTTPFRRPQTIDLAITHFLKNPKADSLRSVCLCSEHPYKMWTLNADHNTMKPLLNKKLTKHSKQQQTLSYHLLPQVFIQNASIYITKPQTIERFNNTIGKNVLFFEMTANESIDINTPIDFEFAEFYLKKNQNKILR